MLFASGWLSAQDLLAGADYHRARGDSLYMAGNYSLAREHYKLALMSSKSDAELNYQIAKTYLKMNKRPYAIRHLRRASRIGYYKADLMLDSLYQRTNSEQERNQILKEMKNYYQAEPENP